MRRDGRGEEDGEKGGWGVVLQWREVSRDCSLCLREESDYVTTALKLRGSRTFTTIRRASARWGEHTSSR